MARILSSRILTQPQGNLLLNADISYVDYSAIHIVFKPYEGPKAIENAIVTSQNTVKALVENKVAITRCFCVGEKTKALLEAHGYTVVVMKPYGSELAQELVSHYADLTFVFFCGNQRREVIPTALRENHIAFEEYHLYETVLNPQKFNRQFDGILFFSPTQVKSYVECNKLDQEIAFCIGTTTAAEAKKHATNVIVARQPTVENVIVQVVKTYRR